MLGLAALDMIGTAVAALLTAVAAWVTAKAHTRVKRDTVAANETLDVSGMHDDVAEIAAKLEQLEADVAAIAKARADDDAAERRKEERAEMVIEVRKQIANEREDEPGPGASSSRRTTLPHRGPR